MVNTKPYKYVLRKNMCAEEWVSHDNDGMLYVTHFIPSFLNLRSEFGASYTGYKGSQNLMNSFEENKVQLTLNFCSG